MNYYHGKRALITGGASGIGKSLAERLAKLGATVIITDINGDGVTETARHIASQGGKVFAYTHDVADAEATHRLAETVHGEHGVLDFLFNNAGIGVSGDILSIPVSAWQKVIDINVMGIIHCSSAFVPAMIERGGGGHVINTASASGYFPMHNMTPYVASKYAAIGISGCQRLEWAGAGIRVTAVCPGIIHTNVVKNMLVYGVMARKGVKERAEKRYVRRGYSPEKVASVVLKKLPKAPYILPVSPEAWITYLMMRLKPSSTILKSQANKNRHAGN